MLRGTHHLELTPDTIIAIACLKMKTLRINDFCQNMILGVISVLHYESTGTDLGNDMTCRVIFIMTRGIFRRLNID